MQLTITGKQIEIGEPLRDHVAVSLGAILEKYFKTAVEAHVVLSPEAHLVRTEISLHIGRGIIVNAGAVAQGGGAAFDAAAERIAKQLRRHKRRLRAHHARPQEEVEIAGAAENDAEGSADNAAHRRPEAVAETVSVRPKLSCGEATIGTDRAAAPLLPFRT